MRTYRRYLWLLLLLAATLKATAQSDVSFLLLQPDKLENAREVEREALKKSDTLLLAEAYYLYGKVHQDALDLLTAKRYFAKSLRIVEQRRQFDKVSRIYVRLSGLEQTQANLPEALKNAKLSLSYARSAPPKTLMSAYLILGKVYLSICQDSLENKRQHPLQDSLFYYCKRAEQMAYQLKDTIMIAATSTLLGKAYGFRRNPRTFHYYQVAWQIQTARNHTNGRITICQQIAHTYLLFDQPDKAYVWLQRADLLYPALNGKDEVLEYDLAKTWMEYYRQKKNWQKAYEQSVKVRSHEHDQMTADRNGAVSRLHIQYNSEKNEERLQSKERELEVGRENQRTQRRFLVALAALLFGTTGASIAFYRISQKNRRLSRQNAALVQEQNHRVKNNLQLISSLLNLQSNRLSDESARNAVEGSQRRIEVMSLLQRRLYDGDNLLTVHVADFVWELVTMVMQTFDQEQVEVTYEIEPDLMLSTDNTLRVGLILNELISNACKYAFPGNPKPTLHIAAFLTTKTFHMRVTDNGPGFPDTKASDQSFGLRLIQMQVEQLFGTCRFENSNGGSIYITFPLFAPLYSKDKNK